MGKTPRLMKPCLVTFWAYLLQGKLIEKVDGKSRGETQGEADGLPLCLSTFVNQQLKGWRNKVGVLQDVLV